MTPTREMSEMRSANARNSVESKMVKLLKYLFSTVAVLLMLGIPFSIFVTRAREDTRCAACRGRLAYLRLGLWNYKATYGSLPVSALDPQGKPLHSWRVLLLPFVDGSEIYSEYRFSEPWNSPHNSQIQRQRVHYEVYSCPSCIRNHIQTNFLALRGQGTLWSEPRSSWGFPTSGVLIVEMPGAINWMDPADIEIEDAISILSTAKSKGIFPHRVGAHYMRPEFPARVIPRDATEAMVRETLTQRGGDF